LIVGDPSKAASKATQAAILAGIPLVFTVVLFVEGQVLFGCGWLVLSAGYAERARRAAVKQKKTEMANSEQSPHSGL
jgi:hypothetical protein